MHELKPLRTIADHAAAIRAVDKLLAGEPKPKSAALDRLEALTILIEAFERSHPSHRIDTKVDPIAAIEFHLERLSKTTKDLEFMLGCSRTRVWELLNRQRPLTLAQIRALVGGLGISADRLVAEYPTARPQALKAARKKVPQKSPTRRHADQRSTKRDVA